MSTATDKNAESGDKAKPTYSTRVFKKAAPNNKITAYLGRRDFFDTGEKVDVVDGVVLVDKDYMNRETGWKVFVHLSATFRYGREDLEAVTGLIYKKDIYSKHIQVYPPSNEDKKITRLQDRLIKKLGDSAYPFLFELPRHLAASVGILPAPGENGKPCGVDYQLTAFVGFGSDDKIDKKNSVKMAIKKLNLITDNTRKQPAIDLKKDFVLSNYPVCIEARLDKELYVHGEEIKLFLNIDNRSSKTIKSLVVEVKQYSEITVGGINTQYKSIVAQVDSEVGFPINASGHLSQTYGVTPSIDCNTRQETRRGCALDGAYKAGESNLAASSVMGDTPTNEMKEAQAIVIQYKLKAKLTVVRGTDIKFDLPFRITHSRPAEPVFVRKTGEGTTPQYVTVNQTEAANLMSTMSEYTSLKKNSNASEPTPTTVPAAEKKPSADAGRISAPPAATYSTVQKARQPPSSTPAPVKEAAPTEPAVSNDLIDLMMFDPTKTGQGSSGAAPANVNLDPLLGGLATQPQVQQTTALQQQGFMLQQTQQPVYAQTGANFISQSSMNQPMVGQPMMGQQPFGQAQPFMQPGTGGFAPQQAPVQQPFMQMQQPAGAFGAAPMQMSASNPFAMPTQPQQPFMQQQQAPQNFMAPQQQQQQQQQQPFAANFANFGGAPAAASTAPNDDDMFFEEFVNMRMDASEA